MKIFAMCSDAMRRTIVPKRRIAFFEPRCLAAVTALLSLGILSGCGGTDRPEVVPVSGTVTFNDEPVAGATVRFLADGAPRPATGVTAEDGTFQLTTYEPNDGAVPGTHRVTVTKSPEQAEPPAAVTDLESDAYTDAMQQAQKTPRGNGGLPGRYADPGRTDLSIEIRPGEPNKVELELKK